MPSPLYVEINPLLTKHLTGIGRFVARLVEALARITPLRLVGTMPADYSRRLYLSNALTCGQEIIPTSADMPAPEEDLEAWVARLMRCPRYPHDAGLAERSAGLFTFLRSPERHFRREL